MSFKEMGFSKLFCDYCSQSSQILQYYDYNPFDPKSLSVRNNVQPDLILGRLESALKAYNPDELLHDNARKNLKELIENPKCRTIATGQQLTFGGGPLFTMFKILTAISEAKRVSSEVGHPVVPIFWLADEDQDFDEISSVTVPVGAEAQTVSIDPPIIDSQRAGFIPVSQNVQESLEKLIELLPDTEFRGEVAALLNEAYQIGNTHNDAFGHLILKLFSRYGLLVFGSVRPESRVLLKDTFRRLLSSTEDIYTALESVSASLEETYHRQVSISKSNWFICAPDGSRSKLNYENGTWVTLDGTTFTTSELAQKAYDDPQLLSPNVFMRPILQDALLPNLGIVAGPGEVAYYAQTQKLYQVCGKPMPVVIPRFSGMLLEPSIVKNLSELPFEIPDFSRRHEDLETEFVQKTQDVDLNDFFDVWTKEISTLADSKSGVIESIDPTLIGTLKRIETDQINALNQLKGKIFKAVKSKQDVQIKRIHRVQSNLYPARTLQERGIGYIYFLSKYGFGIIDRVLESVQSNSFDSHHLIEL